MSKTALVTGASAGLGKELAWLLAAGAHDLVLVARRRENLEALAVEIKGKHQLQVHVLAEDLAKPSPLFKSGVMGAREVAQDAYDAMMRGEPLSVAGFANKVRIASLRVAPRGMVRSMAAGLNKTGAS
jgi:short-subunit dehydrogenase